MNNELTNLSNINKLPNTRSELSEVIMSSILKNEGDIPAAAQYLLNVYDIENIEDLDGIQQIARLFYTNGF